MSQVMVTIRCEDFKDVISSAAGFVLADSVQVKKAALRHFTAMYERRWLRRLGLSRRPITEQDVLTYYHIEPLEYRFNSPWNRYMDEHLQYDPSFLAQISQVCVASLKAETITLNAELFNKITQIYDDEFGTSNITVEV